MAEQKAPAKEEKKAPKAKEKTVVFFAAGKTKLDDKMKIPPQARVIVEAVTGAGKKISRDDLAANISEKLKTKQPPTRVIGYYTSHLQELGLVTVTKEKVPVEKAA